MKILQPQSNHKIKNVPEKFIVRAVKDYLTVMQKKGVLVFQRNNTGAYPSEYRDRNGVLRKRMIRFGAEGSPDFYVFLSGGRTLHLECKSAKGKISEPQAHWKTQVEKLGHLYAVVYSVTDLIALLRFCVQEKINQRRYYELHP